MVEVTEEALDDDAEVIEAAVDAPLAELDTEVLAAAEDALLPELDNTEVIEAAEDVSDVGAAEVTDDTEVVGLVTDDTCDVVAVVTGAVVTEASVVVVVGPEVLLLLW